MITSVDHGSFAIVAKVVFNFVKITLSKCCQNPCISGIFCHVDLKCKHRASTTLWWVSHISVHSERFATGSLRDNIFFSVITNLFVYRLFLNLEDIWDLLKVDFWRVLKPLSHRELPSCKLFGFVIKSGVVWQDFDNIKVEAEGNTLCNFNGWWIMNQNVIFCSLFTLHCLLTTLALVTSFALHTNVTGLKFHHMFLDPNIL